MKRILCNLILIILFFSFSFSNYKKSNDLPLAKNVELLIPTFLGNKERRFYGKGPVPTNLKIIWKKYLGGNKTKVLGKVVKWYRTGWHGQPVLLQEGGRKFVLFGALDYNLYKLDAQTGQTVWKHKFSNVIKGTPNIVENYCCRVSSEKYVVLAGSRSDFKKRKDGKITNFRAISLQTGCAFWSFSMEKTESYSRDVDATGLYSENTLFFGAENGLFYFINPFEFDSRKKCFYPHVINRLKLYDKNDLENHRKNVVIESFPALQDNIVYISCGSGHIYGIDITTQKKVWDFFVGSDIDSTVIVTNEGNILVGIEKQYIKGNGGVFFLNPSKGPEDAIIWFFPTEDKKFASWEGGVIGSVSVNDEYNLENRKPAFAIFCALDGNIYLVARDQLDGKKYFFPDMNKQCYLPSLVWKCYIGPSISTPIFVDDYIICCGYDKYLRIFKVEYIKYLLKDKKSSQELFDSLNCKRPKLYVSRDGNFWKINVNLVGSIKLSGPIESTPIVWQGRIYVGCKGGFFYCIVDKEGKDVFSCSNEGN